MEELKKRLQRKIRRVKKAMGKMEDTAQAKGVIRGLLYAIHEIEDMTLEEVAR